MGRRRDTKFGSFLLTFAKCNDYHGFKTIAIEWQNGPIDAVLSEINLLDSVDPWSVDDLDVLEDVASSRLDIMLDQSDFAHLSKVLNLHGIKYTTMIDDVGKVIANQRREADALREFGDLNEEYFQYLFYDELDEWYRYIVEKYPNFASIEELGKSTEGRPIQGITIGGDVEDKSRKNIFIECGVHAREWISAASCRYFIYQFLAAAENDLVPDDDLSYSTS